MNFEQLQVMWDSQDDEPLFVIEKETLHAAILKKDNSIERWVGWFERVMIGVCVATGIILPIDAWREGDGFHQYIAGALCLGVACHTWVSHRRRLANAAGFGDSMASVLERSISHLDQHMRRLRLLLWCFHFPIALTAGIGLTIYSNTRLPWIWGGVLLLCAVSWFSTWRDIRFKFLPERRSLQSLRDKLSLKP